MRNAESAGLKGNGVKTYNAACAAARAATTTTGDDPPPDETAKASLSRKALDWLRAELAAWTKLLDSADADQRVAIASTLRHWQHDADLAGVRDAVVLVRLPEAERQAFGKLWADVDDLLRRAAAPQ